MIILDTNVLSALMSRTPERAVIRWLDGQPPTSVWITSVTLLEVRFGLQIMPVGRRRAELTKAFETLIADQIEGRVAAFDTDAAQHAADIMALRYRQGRPGDLRDTMIGGIALARKAALATRNVSHYADLRIPIINPWAE